MDIKILVCFHKDSVIISDDIYTPIHVGKSNSQIQLPMIGDNTGDNISELNGLFCELTGLYWGWKNLNADYIGLSHYRRLFAFPSFRDFCDSIKNRITYLGYKLYFTLTRPSAIFMGYSYVRKINNENILKKSSDSFTKELRRHIEQHPETKAFALKPVRIGNLTNYYFFSSVSGGKHIDFAETVTKDLFPHLYPYLEKTLRDNKLYYANMVIMKKDVLDDYCTFLFGVLMKHFNWCLEEKIVSSIEDKAISRLMGYIAEVLTSAYILYLKDLYGKSSVKLLTMIKYE